VKLCLVSVLPGIVKDYRKMRNLPKIFLRSFENIGPATCFIQSRFPCFTSSCTYKLFCLTCNHHSVSSLKTQLFNKSFSMACRPNCWLHQDCISRNWTRTVGLLTAHHSLFCYFRLLFYSVTVQ